VLSATQPLPENFAIEGGPAALPVLLFHGTKDPLVPYSGGPASLSGFRPRGDGMSAPDTAAYYARHNGITTKPTVTRTEGRLPVVRSDYRQAGKPPVTLFTVEGGGHVIPGPGRMPLIVGRTARELVAADEISRFFDPPAHGREPLSRRCPLG
jgi:polyhydroxybutyrate depolymerase